MKNSYRNLFVRQTSVDLAVRMFALADRLVEQRRFALADQLVRSSCSVPQNIAEGQGRLTTADRRHFLVQARASLYEVETELEILHRAKVADNLIEERGPIAKIECGLTRMIERIPNRPS